MCRSITIFKIPYSYNSIGVIDSEKDQIENFSASGADYFHTTVTVISCRWQDESLKIKKWSRNPSVLNIEKQ